MVDKGLENNDDEELKKENLIIDVVLLDAEHIPGSCMFYLHGKIGTFLFTGDCRFSEKMLK